MPKISKNLFKLPPVEVAPTTFFDESVNVKSYPYEGSPRTSLLAEQPPLIQAAAAVST